MKKSANTAKYKTDTEFMKDRPGIQMEFSYHSVFLVPCVPFLEFRSVVSFLIPNPQHTVSLYTFISRINVHGRVGKSISTSLLSEYLQIFLGTSNTGILPDTGVICHDSP